MLPVAGLGLLRPRFIVEPVGAAEAGCLLERVPGASAVVVNPAIQLGGKLLDAAVLVPHIGSATVATRDAMSRLRAENVIAVLEGREPPAVVV